MRLCVCVFSFKSTVENKRLDFCIPRRIDREAIKVDCCETVSLKGQRGVFEGRLMAAV